MAKKEQTKSYRIDGPIRMSDVIKPYKKTTSKKTNTESKQKRSR